MNVNWHKSESRDIRPFFGVESLEDALDNAEIKLYDSSEFSGSESFVVGDEDIWRLKPVIRFNLSAEAIRRCPEVKPADLSLVITLVNPFLKKSLVVARYPLNSEYPPEFPLPVDLLDEVGGGADIAINVALCLDKNVPQKAGRPFLRGHWLSRKLFRLRTPKPGQEFNVQPLDDAGWIARGFPSKTSYWVDYIGPINEPLQTGQSMADVYVHKDIYNKLISETNAKISKPLMTFLAAEITSQLLASSIKDWDDAESPTPHSPLAAFIKRLSRVQKTNISQLRDMVNEPGMPKLRALLHADQGTVRSIVEI
jgi:hypothetical protein